MTRVQKTADKLQIGDVLLAKNGEHLVLRLRASQQAVVIRTLHLDKGECSTRKWSTHRRVFVSDLDADEPTPQDDPHRQESAPTSG